MGDRRLAGRQGRQGVSRPKRPGVLGHEGPHLLDDFIGLPVPAGSRQRQGAMGARKGTFMVADPGLRQVGDRLPSVPDIRAAQLEPLQQRGIVLDVDKEVGHGLHQRRVEVAQPVIVNLQPRAVVAALYVEQGQMPPEVMGDMVRRRPVSGQTVNPRDPVGQSALHDQDMGYRVRTPAIGGVAIHRLAAAFLGEIVGAILLQAECPDRQVDRISGHIGGPMRGRPFGNIAHPGNFADPEQFELGQPQREQIMRVVAGYLLKVTGRFGNVAGQNRVQRAHIVVFPLGGGFMTVSRRLQLAPGQPMQFRLSQSGEQNSLGGVRQRKQRVRRDRRIQMRYGIGAKTDIGVQASIKRLDRHRIACRNSIPPLVFLHPVRPRFVFDRHIFP
jgi:hypothetical protein